MRRLVGGACVLVALISGCSRQQPVQEPADLVIVAADVQTMDEAAPHASAVAVRQGKIVYVGDDAAAKPHIGPQTRVVQANGMTVLPGLIDSHIHAAEGALGLGGCSLDDRQLTVEAAGTVIRECLAQDPAKGWLVVSEVNSAGFKADRKALDAIVADRPLFLWGADGHTGWVNSKGLATAGITRDTKDPEDGRIERTVSGEPTGFLVDGALGPVTNALDKPSPEKLLQALREVLPLLHAAGITSYLEANTSAETVAAYAELARRHELSARVSIALATDGKATDEEFARLDALRRSVANEPLLRADFIKLFADGVMEYPTQTAAMLEPYTDAKGKPTSRGKLYLEEGAMKQFFQRADKDGFNIHVHAIGDAAVRETLNAIEAVRAAGSKRLYSIAHLQSIDPADLPRFAQLDTIASLQLFWALPDNYSVDALLPYIGAERQQRIYPARSLRAAGATVAGGSDWDVSSFNPFEAMATGMSRANPAEPARGVLNVKEALTLDELLHAYTINAARLIGRDAEVGSIAAGKAGDLIVLDRRLTGQSTADDVRATKVTQTFFAGRPVTP
ncbi:MAG TPA: amidohydrolase [Steroidobacteraceae bacterium]|nr:amidohydrolase [Steroidobacteraceae bacterium]